MKSPLPIRDGVAPSYLWLPDGDLPRLLAFLTQHFSDVSPATWLDRISKGEVVEHDGTVLAADSVCRRGMCIFYYRELDNETLIPFDEQILHQDEHILVVDKPHFLPVIPSGRFLHQTLLVRLKKKLDLEHLTPIHRLDRETAGVIIFSHNLSSRGAYQTLFQKRKMVKVYEALAAPLLDAQFPLTYRSRLVEGVPFFRSQEVAGEANTETRIEVLAQRGDLTLYQLHPLSGKKHQLRVHLAALGIPILNDVFYPEVRDFKEDDFSHPLQLLARSISFPDPLTGETRTFESSRKLQF